MQDFANAYNSYDNNFTIHHTYNTHPCQDSFELHKHRTYEIYLFLQGVARFYIEGKYYEMTPNDIIIMNYNELHVVQVNKAYPYERMVMQLSDNIVAPFADRHIDFFSPMNDRPLGIGNLIPSSIVKQYHLDDFIHHIFKLAQEGGQENDVITQCVVVELLASIKKATTQTPVVGPAEKAAPKVNALLEYINENLEKALNLDALAAKFFMSKYHMCHIFKETTGFSINQYISMKRVIFAHSLIAAGCSTTNACFQSGFNDYSTFYKAYRKFMQCSPQSSKQN